MARHEDVAEVPERCERLVFGERPDRERVNPMAGQAQRDVPQLHPVRVAPA